MKEFDWQFILFQLSVSLDLLPPRIFTLDGLGVKCGHANSIHNDFSRTPSNYLIGNSG